MRSDAFPPNMPVISICPIKAASDEIVVHDSLSSGGLLERIAANIVVSLGWMPQFKYGAEMSYHFVHWSKTKAKN